MLCVLETSLSQPLNSLSSESMGQGRSSQARITNQDRAILDMKLQRDKLKQYQKKIETVLKLEEEVAKQCLLANNKPKALIALRKKKFQENLLSKTDQQLETLQNLVSSVEFSLIEKDVLFGLNQGNQILKEIHKELNIENVEKLMSETADSIAYQNEIGELLMSQMTNEEEEEVHKELEILQSLNQKVTDPQLVPHDEPPVSLSLPDVPTTALPAKTQTASPAEEPPNVDGTRVREREAIPA
ncbi:Vacuolar protein sorting-associated protein 20 [Puccinia graminis f. sp. tritici]|uniref:Vacuolar protein sorting-associated protein 20 n=1 Tax=Puccinia graminis f. sp. tritici TaxID=56615 RepID=A0A5B0QAU2_PUCGR|nr:Vacuolar protein sorting-associated protein 20 [Puccinia graminis f. sp. tritici]